MIVYHGSTVIVENPDVRHSYRTLDFGMGFYVTTVREQAKSGRGERQTFWGKIMQS